MGITETDEPLAIAMWDFSWLERRYPGGGYEDWDQALDELIERGYDAVRIDAFPHFVATDPGRTWTLPPNQMAHNDWGAPGTVDVQAMPALTDFLGKCADRDLQVGLSTWFREDDTDARMAVETPRDLGDLWIETLDVVADHGLDDAVCFVDLCNEFPAWVRGGEFVEGDDEFERASPDGRRWLRDSIGTVREAFPGYDYTISFSFQYDNWAEEDVSALDFLELHLWMEQFSTFVDELGVDPESGTAYLDALAREGGELYRSDTERWRADLQSAVDFGAEWSRAADLPLVTTESWAVILAKDWPRLDWAWIRDLCEHGVRRAVETGRWLAVSTSNFCGPQFRGMWRDIDWHRELTDAINDAPLDV